MKTKYKLKSLSLIISLMLAIGCNVEFYKDYQQEKLHNNISYLMETLFID